MPIKKAKSESLKFKIFNLVFGFFLLFALYLILYTSAIAISPPGVKPLPPVLFVMLDFYNKDWGKEHPEWGPVGIWWDWGQGTPGSPEDYIKKAREHTVKLDDGRVIPKPVGVGIKFKLDNVQSWAERLNKPEFDNLAFIVAVAPGLYGEVTSGTYCLPDGRCFSDQSGWANSLVEPLSKAFPNIPVFFQGTVGNLGGLSSRAASLVNKSIALKANGWDTDLENAIQTVDGQLFGGVMGFASAWHDQISVGFEPRHGESIEDIYWATMEALSNHPDFFDIQGPNLTNMALHKDKYGFDLLRFTRDHLGKTIDNTPDVWVVLRTTQITKVCWCGAKREDCMSPDCCYTDSGGRRICIGPQRTNFSYWLYQKDDVPGGKTKTLRIQGSSLPAEATNHPYARFIGRQTDQNSQQPFMFFDIEDGYTLNKNSFEITVTFVNYGSDKLSLEYLNKNGQRVKKTINKGQSLGNVNGWVDYKWTLTDADFSNKLDGGTDFLINCDNDGDEYIHRVMVKGIGPGGTPNPTQPPQPTLTTTPTVTPTVNNIFFGLNKIIYKNGWQFPSVIKFISFKERNFWWPFSNFNLPQFLENKIYYLLRK